MSFPVVSLDSIPTPGLTVEVGDWARAGCGEGLGGASTKVGGRLHVARTGRHIVVQGTLEGAADAACDRCGEPLHVTVAGEVDCVYVPVDELAARAEDDEPPEEAADQGE